jgi:hypothetical protein
MDLAIRIGLMAYHLIAIAVMGVAYLLSGCWILDAIKLCASRFQAKPKPARDSQ